MPWCTIAFCCVSYVFQVIEMHNDFSSQALIDYNPILFYDTTVLYCFKDRYLENKEDIILQIKEEAIMLLSNTTSSPESESSERKHSALPPPEKNRRV